MSSPNFKDKSVYLSSAGLLLVVRALTDWPLEKINIRICAHNTTYTYIVYRYTYTYTHTNANKWFYIFSKGRLETKARSRKLARIIITNKPPSLPQFLKLQKNEVLLCLLPSAIKKLRFCLLSFFGQKKTMCMDL